jgi:peptidoglycan/xylan/chitin deacetylase (PgdA/CDA1 family)
MSQGAFRPYGSLLLSLGAGLVAAGLLLLVLMLRVLIGPFSVAAAFDEPLDSRLSIGLLEPDPRSALSDWERDHLVELWRELLPREAGVERLMALPEHGGVGPDVVVAVDLRWLDDEGAGTIERFVREGGALLCSGWIGVRAGEEWKAGERRMARLLGAPSVARNAREQSYFVAAGGRGPLVAALDPGLRMGMGARPDVPALPDPEAELYWSNWSLRPSADASGASRRRELGKGRMVWIAPTPESAQADFAGQEAIRTVVAHALDWAARRPRGELLAWPEGAAFAALLAMDTEAGFAHALGVAEVAGRHAQPITFLVLSSEARAHPEVMARIASAGEIGSHSDVHDGFRDLPLAVQRERLARSRRELEAFGVPALEGFRPPYESYDDTTRRALVEEGFRYLLGDLEADRMVPRVVSPDGPARRLVQVPRAVADDHELMIKHGISDPAQLRERLHADIERAARGGGLYYFSFHTQHFGTPDRLELLAWLADQVRARGAWRATAGELVRWWERRDSIRVRFERSGPHRLEVRLTYEGREPVSGVALRVHLNAPLGTAKVSGAKLFQAVPELRAERGQEQLDLRLPELSPGSSHAWTLDYTLASN